MIHDAIASTGKFRLSAFIQAYNLLACFKMSVRSSSGPDAGHTSTIHCVLEEECQIKQRSGQTGGQYSRPLYKTECRQSRILWEKTVLTKSKYPFTSPKFSGVYGLITGLRDPSSFSSPMDALQVFTFYDQISFIVQNLSALDLTWSLLIAKSSVCTIIDR